MLDRIYKFDPKKEVPSLELCKKLKKLGFPQNGGGWYWDMRAEGSEEVRFFERTPKARFYLKAPTVRELGEILKDYSLPQWFKDTKEWRVIHSLYLIGVADTEADARAIKVIYLRENGYLSFEKER